jgi:4-hydroxy-3-methylbut-2-enyl diphosphate reductase
VNPRSYRIGAPADIDPAWVRDGDRVGVCGATSTPKWLLEAVVERLTVLGSSPVSVKGAEESAI